MELIQKKIKNYKLVLDVPYGPYPKVGYNKISGKLLTWFIVCSFAGVYISWDT